MIEYHVQVSAQVCLILAHFGQNLVAMETSVILL